MFGAPCHLVEPSVRTIPQWLAKISEVRGTITGAPDFAWRLATRLVDPRNLDLSSLRFATNGGEPVRRARSAPSRSASECPASFVPATGSRRRRSALTFHVPGDALFA